MSIKLVCPGDPGEEWLFFKASDEWLSQNENDFGEDLGVTREEQFYSAGFDIIDYETAFKLPLMEDRGKSNDDPVFIRIENAPDGTWIFV